MKNTAKKNAEKRQATIQVAFNPLTRKYEEVFPESELDGETVITMYWSESAQRYVTVPED